MKTLIKNAYIIDGSGKKGFYGSISIHANLIENISQDVDDESSFDRIIDAHGLVVSPGFIDTHSHSDVEIMKNIFIEEKVRQGITTEVLGQDGISVAPLPKEYINSWRKYISGVDGDSDSIDWNYETVEGYFKILSKIGLAINQSFLVPHGNVRMEAMGLENRIPTDVELEKMKNIIRREMKAGGIGFSTGLTYTPCVYSNTEELIECCKVVNEFGGVFVVHQRSEGDNILESMDELLEIGKMSGIKIHISHMKVKGIKGDYTIDKVIEKIRNANEQGIRVSFDQYPYVAGSTMLGALLPPWVNAGGTDKLFEYLNNQEIRQKIIKDIENGIEGWDNTIKLVGPEKIYISNIKTDKNIDVVGKNLIQISQNKNVDVYNCIFDLLLEEENCVSMIIFSGKEEHIKKFMKCPEQNVCTDGLISKSPHPRLYGSFPRILGKYVREEKVLTIEEAIYKMTYKAAQVFGFKDRGSIKKGMKADLVIFDENEIIDRATYSEPKKFSEGIKYVLVNGEVILENGIYNKKLVGEIIKIS